VPVSVTSQPAQCPLCMLGPTNYWHGHWFISQVWTDNLCQDLLVCCWRFNSVATRWSWSA